MILFACNGNRNNGFTPPPDEVDDSESVTGNVSGGQYDPNRGIGKYNAENLVIKNELNEKMAKQGQEIYQAKCQTCHQLSSDTLTGPGFKEITKRRTNHWIMNYVLNPHPMIEQDIRLKEMAEKTNTVMPDLQLTDVEARAILEYLRQNDGVVAAK